MYYPKSQIQTNLYTNGKELVYKKDNKNYIGYYWKVSSGKFFTGKTPEDLPTEELITPNSQTSNEYSNLTSEAFTPINLENRPYLNPNSDIINEYTKLNKDFILSTNNIVSYNPLPKEEDYKLGEFTRYFCKKTNELYYIEINKDTFQKLIDKNSLYPWQLYYPFKYQWVISGNKESVYKINKNITEYMINNLKLYMLDKFLKEDYIKFWKP